MCELTAENPDVDVFFGPEIAHTEAEQKTGPVEVKKSGCHGFCEMGPLMRIEPMGILYTKVQLSDCEEIFHRTIERGDVIRHLLFKQDGIEYKKQEEIPFYKKQTRNVLKNCGHIDSEHIQEYIAAGGYRALEKVLFEMTPAQVIEEISESNLRGRGGGGFPTGYKWSQVARQPEKVRRFKNFTEQYINQSITSIEALTNGEQLSFLPLVTILCCVLNAAIRWSFWNSITIINAYPLKNFTRKPCPNLVESVLLHKFIFSIICVIILLKEGHCHEI